MSAQALMASGVPASFFAPRRKRWPNPPRLRYRIPRRLSRGPEEQGYLDGLADRHYLPELDFGTGEEYIAWLSGWRRGQARRKEARP